jgi:hypothetical protein
MAVLCERERRNGCRARLGEGAAVGHYGQPTPGAGASTLSTWPARGPWNMFSGSRHSVAVMKSVLRSRASDHESRSGSTTRRAGA